MLCQSEFSSTEAAADQGATDVAYYRRVLHELIDMGADLARLVHRQAMAPVDGDVAPAPDATVAFDRISRAIRRCISLARRLDEPLPARDLGPAQRRVAARKRVIRAVEDAIDRGAEGGEAGHLHAEFLERLDGPDFDDDLDHRPVADIIADICRDLGLGAPSGTRPWRRRTPTDIAELCARAAGLRAGGAAAGRAPPQAARAAPWHGGHWARGP